MRTEHWTVLDQFKTQPTRALEIGSYEGRSTIWLLENILTHEDSTITCIDAWNSRNVTKEHEARFDRNILASGYSTKVQKLKEDHWRALCHLPYGFDLCYIDGDHEAQSVFEDAVWSFRLTKPNGIIIFDDYEWHGKCNVPPKPAIDGFLQSYQPRLEILHKEYQVIVRKVK